MAAAGRKVALISTDPAHSLGDAVDMKGIRNLQECTLIGVPGDTGEGSLSVLEIDPTKSLSQFKSYMDQLVNANADQINPGMRDTLNEVKDIFDTLPAGTDEVVALARIVNLVKSGDYDRIVLDTAPTGHTLRMLSTPSFLADLIERLIRFSDKLNSNSVAKLLLGKNRETVEAAVAAAKSKLLSFQFQMYDLEDMFADAENTEFLIVTVPTELAARESMRLLNDLTFNEDAPIKVRNVVINQVLRSSDDDAAVFLKTVEHRQKFALDDLEGFAKNKGLQVTKVPYLDTEPRGVYGLASVARELLRTEAVSPAAVQ
jgi:arsenite/tail-anchored protein-transporting ATPase